jgi:hypothetical protein
MAKRAVHVFVAKSNRNRLREADLARRLLDLLGRVGIMIKRGQTNARFLAQGYFRFVFPSRALAIRYQDLVDEHCPSIVTTKRYLLV